MDAIADDHDVATDSDFDDEGNELPAFGQDKSKQSTAAAMQLSKPEAIQTQTKSRASMSNVFIESDKPIILEKDRKSKPVIIKEDKEQKGYRLHINDESIFDVPEAEYMPFYSELKLKTSWWLQIYEPCRNKQNQTERRHVASKNPKTFEGQQIAPSPHHNESINLAFKNIKSLYNVQANEVVKQLQCIEQSNHIKLKPIKELFYQSNPTLIPMEFFDVTEYIDAHINSDDAFKFRYIIQYCNANLRDRTSLHRTNTNSSN